jgi:hypothetical protein
MSVSFMMSTALDKEDAWTVITPIPVTVSVATLVQSARPTLMTA